VWLISISERLDDTFVSKRMKRCKFTFPSDNWDPGVNYGENITNPNNWPFFTSQQLLSHSRYSYKVMKPHGSLPCSQNIDTCLLAQSDEPSSHLESAMKNWIYLRNGLWRPIAFWDVEDPTFSRQSAQRWRWGCQLYAPSPQLRFLETVSVWGLVKSRAIVGLEGSGILKVSNCLIGIPNPVTQYFLDFIFYTNIYKALGHTAIESFIHSSWLWFGCK
jgi:hypothetical protein